MAKDYLGIPGLLLIFYYLFNKLIINKSIFYSTATSVPAERVFSSAGDIVTLDRVRLSDETIRAVICLKHWYRSDLLN
jgi:hAT family C-terminal dimerisation region